MYIAIRLVVRTHSPSENKRDDTSQNKKREKGSKLESSARLALIGITLLHFLTARTTSWSRTSLSAPCCSRPSACSSVGGVRRWWWRRSSPPGWPTSPQGPIELGQGSSAGGPSSARVGRAQAVQAVQAVCHQSVMSGRPTGRAAAAAAPAAPPGRFSRRAAPRCRGCPCTSSTAR